MPRTVRSKNLDLIRWLNYGHDNTCKKLISVTNANYVSQMATGDRDIEDAMANRIEKVMEMPDRWMDRDNVTLMKMSTLDFQIHTLIAPLSESAKGSLLTFLLEFKSSTIS